jgi:hypothetical protein
VNCHDTGEKALFCVIEMALAEAGGPLGVKSIYECVSLIVALLQQMAVLCQVALLVERISKCVISVTAILRVFLRTVGAESEECVSFLSNHFLAGRSISESSGCSHYVTIGSTFGPCFVLVRGACYKPLTYIRCKSDFKVSSVNILCPPPQKNLKYATLCGRINGDCEASLEQSSI